MKLYWAPPAFWVWSSCDPDGDDPLSNSEGAGLWPLHLCSMVPPQVHELPAAFSCLHWWAFSLQHLILEVGPESSLTSNSISWLPTWIWLLRLHLAFLSSSWQLLVSSICCFFLSLLTIIERNHYGPHSRSSSLLPWILSWQDILICSDRFSDHLARLSHLPDLFSVLLVSGSRVLRIPSPWAGVPKALGSGEDGTSEAGASFAWWLLFPSPSCEGFHPWSPPAVSALPFQRKALISQGAGTGRCGAVASHPTCPKRRPQDAFPVGKSSLLRPLPQDPSPVF